jgi:hypothetical protein
MPEEDATGCAGVDEIAVLGSEEEGEGEGSDGDCPAEGSEYINPFANEEERLVCICFGGDGYDGWDSDKRRCCQSPLVRS